MTTKLKFLWVLLALLVGGVNGARAVDSKTFISSNQPAATGGAGSSETIGNITVVYGNTTSIFEGKEFTYSSTTYYGLKAHKTESGDLNSNIPLSDSDNFFLQLTTYYHGSMQVGFYNDDDSNARGLKCYKMSTSTNEVTVVNSGYTVSAKTMGTLTFDMEPGYTYYVYDTNTSNIYYTGFTFTPETKTNSVDYSHTWTFNCGANNWPNTVEAMLTANSKWSTGGVGNRYQYQGTVNTSGGDPLYDGNGNLIEETRGLKFSATNASDIQTDLHYDIMLQNGASVIITNAKIGQKIVINGWWPNGGTVTATNAQLSGGATSFSGTGAGAEYTFDVIVNGDASFTVGSGSYYAIWSIAVVKSELTTFAFNNTESYYGLSGDSPSNNHKVTGEFIGRTTTFKYKLGRSQVLRTRVDVAPGFNVNGITVDDTNFGVSSNTSTVLNADLYSLSKPNDGKIWYWGVQVKKPGTASLTYRFNGTDAYNAKEYTELFTIEKDDPVLELISSFLIKTVGDANFTRSLTLNGLSLPFTDDNAGTVNVTYSSDNTSVATVSSTGEVTIGSTPGVANMKITLAATDYNNKVEKSWKLIVNPASGTNPTLSWSDDVSSVSVPYNQNVIHTATVNTTQTVSYSSANPSIATVDKNGVVTGTGIGSTQIYAYVDPTSDNNAVQIEYTVTVTSAGNLDGFQFVPNKGKVNNGKSITPKLVFPTIPNDGVTSLKVTQVQVLERNGLAVSESPLTTDEDIAACDIISIDAASDLRNNWVLNSENKVHKVNVTINGKALGKAAITVTFTSTYYNTATATYTIEVTDASTRNFSWADGSGSPEYYTYAGDFMMLPAISGNSNGNYNYSSGAKNSKSYSEGGTSYSALHAYVYERKWNGSNYNIKWNEKDIKIGEGFPDFAVVTDGISSPGTASVFFARGEGSSHPDTIMVYCEAAGDVKLRAYDPQDHTKYCDATIHILPINNIEGPTGAATTITNSMTYPYTWDFTTNFDMSSMVGTTDQYWIPMKDGNGDATGDYTNGYGFFNLDWADVDKDNNTGDRIYKHFIAGVSGSATGYMHQFNGMMLQLKGSTSWANKMGRMRIKNYDSTNKRGRLQFTGGYHTMKLFLPEAAKRPSSFKIFVKASGTGSVCIMGTDEKEVSSTVKNLSSSAAIYSFDISDVTYTSNGYILLGFDDATVDWIAMSTEAKTIWKRSNTSCPAATYSYAEDLDFGKSLDANNYLPEMSGSNLKAYYASAVSGNSVTLTQVPSDAVQASQGLVLKLELTSDTEHSHDCYMIANPRNVDSYSTLGTIPEQAGSGTSNLLIATTGGETISGTDGDYHNFLLSYKYNWYNFNGVATQSNILTDDWAFYRIHGSLTAPSNNAYLHTTADSYYFNPTTARRLSDEPAIDDEKALNEKNLLYLTFVNRDGSIETTAIDANKKDNILSESDVWYTLQGVPVATPSKGGIYIHNGRKVVVK